MPSVPTIGAVVLSMGDRPQELTHALATLDAQRGVDLDVVVVGNGWEPTGLPTGVKSVHLPENVGVPEGRNVGAAHCGGDFVFFYDDDAALPRDDVLARLARELARRPGTAVVQPRAIDPVSRRTCRRWVPRLRVWRGGRGGVVTHFWEGVFLIRRAVFEEVGRWPGAFFFGHEGIDLAWRVGAAGHRIRYHPEVVVNHPATDPARHDVYYRLNARNRVWVARRNLPHPLVGLYLVAWILITLVRVHRVAPLRDWAAGLHQGLRTDPGPRRPMPWRTVLRLAFAGRPPIL